MSAPFRAISTSIPSASRSWSSQAGRIAGSIETQHLLRLSFRNYRAHETQSLRSPCRRKFHSNKVTQAQAAPTPRTGSTSFQQRPSAPPPKHEAPKPAPPVSNQVTELQEDDPSQVDWSKSFHGLSVEPFAKEAADILLAPINEDDVEIKPDGIIYLPEIKYRRILNKAFGPGGWGLAPRGETIVTDKAVTREYALLAHGR